MRSLLGKRGAAGRGEDGQVGGHLQVVFRLGHRAARDFQIPDGLGARGLAAALSNVCRNREGCSSQLGAHDRLLGSHDDRSEEVNLLRKNPGAIPDSELPEVVHTPVKRPSVTNPSS